jgi:hypothetical protein
MRATQIGGIDSLESISGLLKRLQIRSLRLLEPENSTAYLGVVGSLIEFPPSHYTIIGRRRKREGLASDIVQDRRLVHACLRPGIKICKWYICMCRLLVFLADFLLFFLKSQNPRRAGILSFSSLVYGLSCRCVCETYSTGQGG